MADYAAKIRAAAERAKKEAKPMTEPDSNYEPALQDLFSCTTVASTAQISEALDVSLSWAREWAETNVDKVGNVHAWTLDVAQRFAEEVDDELGSDDADGDDEEDEDEPEDE
jgi:hypothetical protein